MGAKGTLLWVLWVVAYCGGWTAVAVGEGERPEPGSA